MRQKISVEQVNASIDQQQVEKSIELAEHAINELSALSEAHLCFCEEKLDTASESFAFLLKQWVQLFKRGYPSREHEYLRLIERQMNELKQVYFAFYRLAPGLIHMQKTTQPDIYVWLMLQPEFGAQLDNLLCGLSQLNELEQSTADLLVAQSQLVNIDQVLVELIEGRAANSLRYFDCLKVRHTLSISLIKRWLKAGIVSEKLAYSLLAQNDVKEAIEWLNDHAQSQQHLFERLLTKHDRTTWFRQYFGTDPNELPSKLVLTYGKLLDLAEFSVFDVHSEQAPYDFVLCGDTNLVPEIIDHVTGLDEFDGEIWVQALYVVYGDDLPLTPKQVGIELEWEEVIQLLQNWLEEEGFEKRLPSRLGFELSFDSTLAAMQNTDINHIFRQWLWRQLCIHSRAFLPWNMVMPVFQQEWIFHSLKSVPSARERFNLRNSNAIVGY
ncbi:hypothetical protein BS333_15830 [Vibrio azureus]|uniref:Uncharacterized protein n=1 Tax=Vibrio azureus NBRC 104587 TaxID=1219077 RepID=U3C498_9VIBR|nr:hypothetical protein [Vibrio azureus]AUI87863.1 hypothetical protein BS333_15830 [Vibrio azureus]GAD76254.1 hypothetical protein VAZ01S_040_00080 [Vibrio azureus NBRC 104587]